MSVTPSTATIILLNFFLKAEPRVISSGKPPQLEVSNAQYSDGSLSSSSQNPPRSAIRRIIQISNICQRSNKAIFVGITCQPKDEKWAIKIPEIGAAAYVACIYHVGDNAEPLRGVVNCSSLESRPPPDEEPDYLISLDMLKDIVEKVITVFKFCK